MPQLRANFSYEQVVAMSERVAWRIEDVLPPRAEIDLTCPHLPEALTHLDELPLRDHNERLVLNHIRGHSYMNLFALVEQYIIAEAVRHAEAEMFSDPQAVRALLRFGEEEVKHQIMFRRYCERFRESFATPLFVLETGAEVAEAVLSRRPMAVMLMTLHLELMTQRHFTDAVKEDRHLDPLFVTILRHHWMEEAHHAKIDILELSKMSEVAEAQEIEAAFDDYFEIVTTFQELLARQVELDVKSLELALGRSLSAADKEQLVDAQRRSYEVGFIGMGVDSAVFREVTECLSASGARRVRQFAARFSHVSGRS